MHLAGEILFAKNAVIRNSLTIIFHLLVQQRLLETENKLGMVEDATA